LLINLTPFVPLTFQREGEEIGFEGAQPRQTYPSK